MENAVIEKSSHIAMLVQKMEIAQEEASRTAAYTRNLEGDVDGLTRQLYAQTKMCDMSNRKNHEYAVALDGMDQQHSAVVSRFMSIKLKLEQTIAGKGNALELSKDETAGLRDELAKMQTKLSHAQMEAASLMAVVNLSFVEQSHVKSRGPGALKAMEKRPGEAVLQVVEATTAAGARDLPTAALSFAEYRVHCCTRAVPCH